MAKKKFIKGVAKDALKLSEKASSKETKKKARPTSEVRKALYGSKE